MLHAALNYVESLRKYYIEYYNNADNRKDALDRANFRQKIEKASLNFREDYHNKSLEEFVTNKNETTKTIEYKGEIIQKLDPIFMDPKYKFIKAHFYSPTKQIFGMNVDTYIVNVIVLG